jgi:hypothetical protein
MKYAIEYLTVDNTYQVFMTNVPYSEAVEICFQTNLSYEMEVSRMAEEE